MTGGKVFQGFAIQHQSWSYNYDGRQPETVQY